MTEYASTEDLLTDIEAVVRASAPFDLSPRGIRFRPDTELAARIRTVAARDDRAVPVLAARLESEGDPLQSLVWLYCLKKIGTSRAEAAIDAFVVSMEKGRRWSDEFPGQREIQLFLGRTGDEPPSEPGQNVGREEHP